MGYALEVEKYNKTYGLQHRYYKDNLLKIQILISQQNDLYCILDLQKAFLKMTDEYHLEVQ